MLQARADPSKGTRSALTLGSTGRVTLEPPFYRGCLRTHMGVWAEFKVLCPVPSPCRSGPLHPQPLKTPELPPLWSTTRCSQLQSFSAIPSELQILFLGRFLKLAQQVQSFQVFF